MRFMYVPQALPLAVSFALCFGLSIYGLVYRKVAGAVEFVFAASVGTLWALFNALELSGADLRTKLVWSNLHYLIYGFGPLIWLAMVWRFSEKDRRISFSALALLGLMPLITNVLVWLDPLLGLVRHSFTLDTSAIPYIVGKEYGPWYWFHYIYSQGLNLVCVVLLVRAVSRKSSLYRYQSLYILVALSIVYLSNLSFALRLGPVKRYDLTPSLFCFAAVVFWFGVFKHRLFEIVPIARATVLERMANGMIVIDSGGRVIDMNESIRQAFGLGGPGAIGKNLGELAPSIASAIAGQSPVEGGEPRLHQFEFESGEGERRRYYELYASPLLDPSKNLAAWALMVTDITDLRLARERIARQEGELAAARERERLSRDLHDNLGQVLSFAVIQSDAVMGEMRRKDYDLAWSLLERLHRIVKDAHADLRGFVYDLRDREYEEASLRELVLRQVEDFRAHCPGTEVEFVPNYGEPLEFTASEKRHLSQIVKEALNNVAKHAGAEMVLVEAAPRPGRFEIIVSDDGVGIDCAEAERSRSSGLRIMRERAQLLGGSLRLSPREAGGTRLCVEIPYAREI
jgi:PAS domain S-box-containing protein